MQRSEWEELLNQLEQPSEMVQSWLPTAQDPRALRCEQSRHRTLAHLRACQEQWLVVAACFTGRPSPSVTILHSRRLHQ